RATVAELRVNGRVRRRFAVRPPAATLVLRAPPGLYRLRLRFFRGQQPVGEAGASGVWLLPQSSERARPPLRREPGLDARLRALASGFAGHAAIWVQDLRTGSYASW